MFSRDQIPQALGIVLIGYGLMCLICFIVSLIY